jgi:hypothetical protein
VDHRRVSAPDQPERDDDDHDHHKDDEQVVQHVITPFYLA